MSQTRSQRLKLKKSHDRKAKIKKLSNIHKNSAAKKFRLDVNIDGKWKAGIRYWSHWYQVEAHKADTERRRALGEEIVLGQIVDEKNGKVVMIIPASSKIKGMAPDKIADGVKAIDLEAKVTTTAEEKPTLSADSVGKVVAETTEEKTTAL